MFHDFETKLTNWLKPVIPADVPLYGTLDNPELDDAPLAVQVEWGGAGVDARTATVAHLTHTWHLHLYVATGRADPDLLTRAGLLHAALFDRLMRWTDTSTYQPLDFQRLTPPEFDGICQRLSLTFSPSQQIHIVKD